MSLFYDNKNNRVYIKKDNLQAKTILGNTTVHNQNHNYKNAQYFSNKMNPIKLPSHNVQQHYQNNIKNNMMNGNQDNFKNNINNVGIDDINDLDDNKTNQGINLINNLIQKQEHDSNIIHDINNKNSNDLVEVNIQDIFNQYHKNNNNQEEKVNNISDNEINNMIEGPRGLPGLRGPVGPQGPPGNSNLDDELVEKIKKFFINKNINDIEQENQIKEINNTSNNKTTLLYGIKKTNISESNNKKISSSNFLKILKNNEVGNNIIFDSFYLSPNILEINEYSSFNYVHNKQVERFFNIYDDRDIQYFPIDYVPSGFPINLKNKLSRYNNLVITNFTWNIIQNINDSKYDETELLGICPNINELMHTNIDLTINFELHSQIPVQLINNRENIIPYRNKHVKVSNPSKTCLFKIKKIKVNKLNGFKDTTINIPIHNCPNMNNSLLCVRISLDDDAVHQLKGYDSNEKLTYGYLPFNQIIFSMDYYLQ